jgi:mycoredoxin
MRNTRHCAGVAVSVNALTIYTTKTCGDCFFTKRLLDGWGVAYREVDIAEDDGARAFVRSVARGYLSVPTLVFADGRVLVEPSRAELRDALDREPA